MYTLDKTLFTDPVRRTSGWSLRRACHAVIALSAWLLFFYWWRQVLEFTRWRDVVITLVFIFAAVLITSLLTLLWVRHNINLFRRKGPRLRITDVSEARDRDSLGRPIHWPASGVARQSRIVSISSTEKEKFMEAGETR